MKSMSSFFRSKLYLNFWLFNLKCGTALGLSSSVGVTLWQFIAHDKASLSVLTSIYVFFIGAISGLAAAVAGFWVIFALLKARVPVPFRLLTAVVGLILALSVLAPCYRSGMLVGFFPIGLLFFPATPLLLSLYLFVKFSEIHIRPFA